MKGMIVDYTINIGQLLEILALVCGGMVALLRLSAEFATFGDRISAAERELAKLSDVVIGLARQDERLVALRADVAAMTLRLTAVESLRLPPQH